MSNAKHALLFAGPSEKWNEWRRKNPSIRPDLSGEDFRFIKSSHREFSKPGLNNAPNGNMMRRWVNGYDLSGANLQGCKFGDAVIFRSNLQGADLSHAEFRQTLIRESDLRGANCIGTIFVLTLFEENQMAGAHFGQTHLAYSTLHQCNGLDQATYHTASQADFLSLAHSAKLPQVFVENFTKFPSFYERIRQLDTKKFYDCFISHSTKDLEFVNKLWGALMNLNIPSWHSEFDYRINMPWQNKQINDADLSRDLYNMVDAADILMLVLSNNSLQSKWVGEEVIRARKKSFIPIVIEDLDPALTEKTLWYRTLPPLRLDMRAFQDYSTWVQPLAFIINLATRP